MNTGNHYTAPSDTEQNMVARIAWCNGYCELPQFERILVALPGVGNVGKLLIDGIIESSDAPLIARLLHPGLPPHALLDSDGLLAPPHLAMHQLEIEGENILLITGEGQPLSPTGQHEMAAEILSLVKGKELIVLAGLAAPPERNEEFIVCSSATHRIELESLGLDVRRDEPKAGVIGMAALLASLGPVYEVNSVCAVATTIGTSGDPIASERLGKMLEKWFDLDLPSDIEALERLAQKLDLVTPEKVDDYVSELNAPDASYM